MFKKPGLTVKLIKISDGEKKAEKKEIQIKKKIALVEKVHDVLVSKSYFTDDEMEELKRETP